MQIRRLSWWSASRCGLLVTTLLVSPLLRAEPTQSSAVYAASGPVNPLALLDQINQAAQRLTYTGTYIHQQTPGAQGLYMAKIHQQAAPAGPIIRLESLDGDPREVVRMPKEVRAYLPDLKTIKVQQGSPIRADFPMLSLQSAEQIAKSYKISVSAGKRVAGYDTELVTLEPTDDKRWPIRCWVQRHERLMLKFQQLSHGGEVLEEQVFSDIKIGHRAAPNVVSRYASEPGWVVQTSPLQRLEGGLSLSLPVPGFQVVTQLRHRSEGLRQVVISDGVATASVFLEKRRAAAADLVPRQRGALSMASHQHGDWLVTVMGELPPATVLAFAKDIPLSSLTSQ